MHVNMFPMSNVQVSEDWVTPLFGDLGSNDPGSRDPRIQLMRGWGGGGGGSYHPGIR